MALNSTTPDPIRTQLPEPMHGYLAAAQQRLLQRCNPLICRWWEVSHASHPKKHVAAVAMQAEPRPEFPPCVLRPLGTVQTRTVG